ncbi:DUF3823 domain-containing protein [Chitinophaga barathri]|uniref:DUF3823 domain-containing protein n=1 Tax=Chitinophaga barathri TaxID=1647451 RepID=A0A3N4MNJ0_9BACT|nr:DUF3823 domain-containing protein [Chitinophaga barathri]RPD41209.1 DUF3823 domain-containing protein [Chitinophaga barathri]
MKKLICYLGLFILILLASACNKEFDDYPEPSETLAGNVKDAGTKSNLQSEAGDRGIRLVLEELSWSSTPTPYYFFTMQDGTFRNTKIFKGNYRVSVEGPFVPLVQYDGSGQVTVDNRKTMDISGNTNVDFEVEPFLKVEWVGEPVYNSTDATITVQARFIRGTANTAFHANVTDVFLFVNPVSYVGNNNYDNKYSTQVNYDGTTGNDQLGQTVTLTTKDRIPGSRAFYLRVGARVDYGLKYYNYTTIKTINIP